MWFKTRCGSIIRFQISNLFMTSKNETTNSPIHEFKVLQNVLKCFLKEKIRNNTTLKRVLKDSLAFMQYFKFLNWGISGFVFWCHEQVTRVNCIFCFYIKQASAVIVIWENVGKKFLLVQIDQCTKVRNDHFFSGGVGVGQVPLKNLIYFQSFITCSSDQDTNPEFLNLRYVFTKKNLVVF